MRKDCTFSALVDLGTLHVHGADTVRFLQGQLSNDVALLTLQHSLLAGYHNPQGRAIALLRLVQLEPDDLLVILPRELVATVASRLSKFILRAKVKITDESANWRVSGLAAPASSDAHATASELPETPNAQARFESFIVVRVADNPSRWLLISPMNQAPLEPACTPADRETWRLLDIAAGQPQIYAATSEEFVAQMLNLDVLGAVAFDKGCYTGQEVIARAHYRGRVKRRLQRFVSRTPLRLQPGDAGQLTGGRTFKVVEAAQLADGRCEFLAVAPLASGDPQTPAAPSGADATDTAPVDAEQLPLPYRLPD